MFKPLSPSLTNTKEIDNLFKCIFSSFAPNLSIPASFIPAALSPKNNSSIVSSFILDKMSWRPSLPMLHESKSMLICLAFQSCEKRLFNKYVWSLQYLKDTSILSRLLDESYSLNLVIYYFRSVGLGCQFAWNLMLLSSTVNSTSFWDKIIERSARRIKILIMW